MTITHNCSPQSFISTFNCICWAHLLCCSHTVDRTAGFSLLQTSRKEGTRSETRGNSQEAISLECYILTYCEDFLPFECVGSHIKCGPHIEYVREVFLFLPHWYLSTFLEAIVTLWLDRNFVGRAPHSLTTRFPVKVKTEYPHLVLMRFSWSSQE